MAKQEDEEAEEPTTSTTATGASSGEGGEDGEDGVIVGCDDVKGDDDEDDDEVREHHPPTRHNLRAITLPRSRVLALQGPAALRRRRRRRSRPRGFIVALKDLFGGGGWLKIPASMNVRWRGPSRLLFFSVAPTCCGLIFLLTRRYPPLPFVSSPGAGNCGSAEQD